MPARTKKRRLASGLRGPFEYRHARPALTVDCVVFGLDAEDLKLLLIQRDRAPHAAKWALPGGFVEVGERLETAALRELEEETSVKNLFLEQLYTFGEPARDPREHVVSVAYYALVKLSDHRIRASTDARDAAWVPVARARGLAFDHDRIVLTALARLKGKLRYQPIGFELLPRKFTLTQLQQLYETVLERKLDKRNFRRKILSMGLLVELDETQRDVAHRAARLYRFDRRKYQQLNRAGFNFEI
ncbi:MAG: NUDIX domain-containing protein [Phycisphaerae bacterium]